MAVIFIVYSIDFFICNIKYGLIASHGDPVHELTTRKCALFIDLLIN